MQLIYYKMYEGSSSLDVPSPLVEIYRIIFDAIPGLW